MKNHLLSQHRPLVPRALNWCPGPESDRQPADEEAAGPFYAERVLAFAGRRCPMMWFRPRISLRTMEVLGLHHVNVNVHSLPEALEFYVDGLGFTSFERPGFTIDGAWLNMGPHELHLFVRPDAAIDRHQHFALAVTDINDCARHLEAKGLKYRLAPEMAGVNRQIFIHDPSGNRIELNEVKTLS